MVKKILGLIGAVFIILLVIAGLQSPDYHIYREIEIQASPEVVFPYLNNAEQMQSWMPWSDQDEQMKISYSGPIEGIGAKASWVSEGPMGEGEATIIESIPSKSVRSELKYFKPMEMTQIADMSLTATADGTLMRWSVSGQNNIIGRFFCIFINMDKMVGESFIQGLNKLKNMVESHQ